MEREEHRTVGSAQRGSPHPEAEGQEQELRELHGVEEAGVCEGLVLGRSCCFGGRWWGGDGEGIGGVEG